MSSHHCTTFYLLRRSLQLQHHPCWIYFHLWVQTRPNHHLCQWYTAIHHQQHICHHHTTSWNPLCQRRNLLWMPLRFRRISSSQNSSGRNPSWKQNWIHPLLKKIHWIWQGGKNWKNPLLERNCLVWGSGPQLKNSSGENHHRLLCSGNPSWVHPQRNRVNHRRVWASWKDLGKSSISASLNPNSPLPWNRKICCWTRRKIHPKWLC